MEQQRRIFVSYSRTNATFALKLARELKADSFAAWLDQLDIPTGARWDDEVEKALRECEIFIIILTPASVASDNVKDEIGYALGKNKRFIPVMLENCEIPFRLHRFQYVDFTKKSFDEGVQSVKDLLISLMTQPTVHRGEASADTQDQMAQAEAERKAKEDRDRLAAQKAEEEQAAIDKGETKRQADKKVLPAEVIAEPVSITPAKIKPASKRMIYGFGVVFVLAILVIGLSALSTRTPFGPTALPTLGIGSITISERDGMKLLYVPAGEFTMGEEATDALALCKELSSECIANLDNFKNEAPPHMVVLDAFWIDQTEVTNAMFTKFIAETGYSTEAEESGSSFLVQLGATVEGIDWAHPSDPSSDLSNIMDHPVVHVSWKDAQAYCTWANRRLPTEAEWEMAARGIDGRTYPWGSKLPNNDLLNYNGAVGGSTEVDDYPAGASPYGVLDMAGNVWEWVADWYGEDYYSTSRSSNPSGPFSSDYKVRRGGSWVSSGVNVRTVTRDPQTPTVTTNLVGFRCALTP